MKKILLRADDLGYSKGVNYGIRDSIENGMIRNVGVMVNMDQVNHGCNLIQNFDIALGLHTNICNGKPICAPDSIPSLVDEKGNFLSSKYYREAKEDTVNINDAIKEVNAQIEKFIQLIGREPDYVDFHAAASQTFVKALEEVVSKKGYKYSPLPQSFDEVVKVGNTDVVLRPGSMTNENPFDLLQSIIQEDIENPCIVIYHPGYLDQFIMENSSLTFPRIYETTMLCSEATKNFIELSKLELITYKEL